MTNSWQTKTLHAGCSNMEAKMLNVPWGTGWKKFNQLQMVNYIYLQTLFVDDRCMHMIYVSSYRGNRRTKTPMHKQRQKWWKCTALLVSMQCKNGIDRESPSSELGRSSLYHGCFGRSGAQLLMKIYWAEGDEVSQVHWTTRLNSLMHQSCDFECDAALDRQPV